MCIEYSLTLSQHGHIGLVPGFQYNLFVFELHHSETCLVIHTQYILVKSCIAPPTPSHQTRSIFPMEMILLLSKTLRAACWPQWSCTAFLREQITFFRNDCLRLLKREGTVDVFSGRHGYIYCKSCEFIHLVIDLFYHDTSVISFLFYSVFLQLLIGHWERVFLGQLFQILESIRMYLLLL